MGILRKKSLFDQEIAKKLREKRRLSNLTIKFMAQSLGVSMQQYQKYESGLNRISAGNLYELCSKFEWDIKEFFDGNKKYDTDNMINKASTAEIIKLGTLLANAEKGIKNLVLGVIGSKNQ